MLLLLGAEIDGPNNDGPLKLWGMTLTMTNLTLTDQNAGVDIDGPSIAGVDIDGPDMTDHKTGTPL